MTLTWEIACKINGWQKGDFKSSRMHRKLYFIFRCMFVILPIPGTSIKEYNLEEHFVLR